MPKQSTVPESLQAPKPNKTPSIPTSYNNRQDRSKSPANIKNTPAPRPQKAEPQLATQFSQEDMSQITSSKKIRLNKLMGKLNKSLEDFFLKDGPEESSYVDDFSMLKHYNK